jgi:hypothetical protein
MIYSLFQVLVWWVTISDWPQLLVSISIYSKSCFPKEAQGMFQNIMEPSMTHLDKDSFFLSIFKTSLVRKRLHQQFLSAHKLASLTLALMCACLLSKTLIFPSNNLHPNSLLVTNKIVNHTQQSFSPFFRDPTSLHWSGDNIIILFSSMLMLQVINLRVFVPDDTFNHWLLCAAKA